MKKNFFYFPSGFEWIVEDGNLLGKTIQINAPFYTEISYKFSSKDWPGKKKFFFVKIFFNFLIIFLEWHWATTKIIFKQGTIQEISGDSGYLAGTSVPDLLNPPIPAQGHRCKIDLYHTEIPEKCAGEVKKFWEKIIRKIQETKYEI